MSDRDEPIEKNHFKIGEVAEMLGVRPHVLRYWEQEFPSIAPKKTRGAHRHYSREDVAALRRVRDLVVTSGYSIAGARTRLERDRQLALPDPLATHEVTALRDDLLAIRDDLRALLLHLDSGADDGAQHASEEVDERTSVVVNQVRTNPRR